jgi:hypothetical protein
MMNSGIILLENSPTSVFINGTVLVAAVQKEEEIQANGNKTNFFAEFFFLKNFYFKTF